MYLVRNQLGNFYLCPSKAGSIVVGKSSCNFEVSTLIRRFRLKTGTILTKKLKIGEFSRIRKIQYKLSIKDIPSSVFTELNNLEHLTNLTIRILTQKHNVPVIAGRLLQTDQSQRIKLWILL